MIHQIIFAGPKPGMSDQDFQDYWLNVHAVKYASKIKQIKRYMINTTMGSELDSDMPYRGVAEIWLNNDEESLQSLQSPEFIDGARQDEPNWAAFWLSVGVNTDAFPMDGTTLSPKDGERVKLLIMMKRKEGVPLETFRNYSKEVHAPLVKKLEGLRGYMQCHCQAGHYAMGESLWDCVSQLWFDNKEALEKALASDIYRDLIEPDYQNFLASKYRFQLAVKENWVIGPDVRE